MINHEMIEGTQRSLFEIAYLRKSDLELLRLHKQNEHDLNSLKYIMETEEDHVYDPEMVLKRNHRPLRKVRSIRTLSNRKQ